MILKKFKTGFSATELIVAVGVLGIVSVGGMALYKKITSSKSSIESELSITEVKQLIRSKIDCQKTLSEITNSSNKCGFKLLDKNARSVLPDKNGEFVQGGASCGDDGELESGESGAQSGINPFDVGYYTYAGKIDVSVKGIANDGSLIVWARSNRRWLETNSDVKGLSVSGGGIFEDSPILCLSQNQPFPKNKNFCTEAGDGIITFYAGVWDTYSGKGSSNLYVTRSYEIIKNNMSGDKIVTTNLDSIDLDDFAFIVPASLSASDFQVSTRRYRVPDYAYLIINSRHPNYAIGEVNSDGPTWYEYGSNTKYIPGGSNTTVKAIADEVGFNTVDIGEVTVSMLDRPEYKNDDGNIEFKVFYVPHDGGRITWKIEVLSCQ